MKQSSIITQNKKINETDFITTILADIKDIGDTMNQLYEDNKDSILDISYESKSNILTIITKKECILKITEYTDEEIIKYSNEILNELKKIDDYNPSLPPENESSISLEKILNFSQIKREQLQQLFRKLSKKTYNFNNFDIGKNTIILKVDNTSEAKIVGNNLILISDKHKDRLLQVGREIIEECKKYQDFLEDNYYKRLETINSDFIIEMTPDYIIIKKDNNPFFLKYSTQKNKLEESNYLTLDVLEKLNNEDLLNKIFLYPKKCPVWIQKMLKEEKMEEERLIKQIKKIKQKIEENKKIEDKTDLISLNELLEYQRNHYIYDSTCYEEETNPLSGNFSIYTTVYRYHQTTILTYRDYNLNEYKIKINYDDFNQHIYETEKREDKRFLELVKPYLKEILENTYCRKSLLNHNYYHLWKDKDFDKQKKEFINNIKDINEIIKEKNNTNKDDYISLEEIFKNLSIITEVTNNDINYALEIKRKSINSNIELYIDYLSIKIFYNYKTDFNKAETFGATYYWDGTHKNCIDGYTFFPDEKEKREQLFSQIYFSKEDLPEWIILEEKEEKEEKEVQKNKSNRLFNFFGG